MKATDKEYNELLRNLNIKLIVSRKQFETKVGNSRAQNLKN